MYNSTKETRRRLSLLSVGIIFLIMFTLLNTSVYGASLSWVVIPCSVILFGAILKGKLMLHPHKLLLIVFWGIFLFSTLISNIVPLQRDLITFFVFCLVYFAATSKDYSVKEIRAFVNIYILVGLYGSANILLNWVNRNYYNAWFARASFSFMGVYKDPNYTMAFIVPSFALLFLKWSNSTGRKRKYFMPGLLLGILSMIITGSRGAMLTTLLFLIIYAFLPSNMKISKKIAIIIFISGAITLGIVFFIKYLPRSALERILQSSQDSRLDLWRVALRVFYENPIIGGGMNAANTISRSLTGTDSHNVYIDILCNSGFLGAITFVIFFILNCLKSTRANRVFIYSIGLSFMLPMLFINGFNTATFYMPLILLTIFSHYCSSIENRYQDIFNFTNQGSVNQC